MTTSSTPAGSSDDTATGIVLDPDGGGPAVATGTRREQAEQKPAMVQDTASAENPAVEVPLEGVEGQR